MHFSFISTYMLYIGSHTLFTLFRCINTNTHAHTHAHAHAHCSLSNCWAVWAVMLSLVIRVATPKPSILGERAGPAQFITKPQQTTIQTITLIVLTQYPYGMYTIGIPYNTILEYQKIPPPHPVIIPPLVFPIFLSSPNQCNEDCHHSMLFMIITMHCDDHE